MALTARQQATKTHYEELLLNIRAAQKGNFSGGVAEMSVGGRSLTRFNPRELEELETRFLGKLETLDRRESGAYTRTVRVVG